MPIHDFSSQRLYVDAPLVADALIALTKEQINYLLNALRMHTGDQLLIFNGRDGEWKATLKIEGRKDASLSVEKQIRIQDSGPDVDYIFAPLKQARLDYMAQKAVEMGARRLIPVMTRRTQASRINLDRLKANVIEAAEQCGVLSLPEVSSDAPLERVLNAWDPNRLLIFCDEDSDVSDPIAALRACSGLYQRFAILIGPEGGFDPQERARLLQMPHVLRLSLGPRILRADTAAVAALALFQGVLGDFL